MNYRQFVIVWVLESAAMYVLTVVFYIPSWPALGTCILAGLGGVAAMWDA